MQLPPLNRLLDSVLLELQLLNRLLVQDLVVLAPQNLRHKQVLDLEVLTPKQAQDSVDSLVLAVLQQQPNLPVLEPLLVVL